MDEKLKNNIAGYVNTVGVEDASINAFSKLRGVIDVYYNDSETFMEMADHMVGVIKFNTSVIEYLHCSDGEADSFCETLAVNKNI